MKPKKRHFCMECGRYKMLFETEKKALNFMKFNNEEIMEESGVAPQRAYYCESCGGWHVTKMPKYNYTVSRTEQAIEQMHKEEDLNAEVKKRLEELLKKQAQ